jgi:hypothetical protein
MVIQLKDVTFVKDLKLNDSVIYKGSKYLISSIAEGPLRTIRLVSLTHPREIKSVNWHNSSTIQSSSTTSNTYEVVDYIDSFIFKTTHPDKPNWVLDNIQQSICINGLLKSVNIHLPIHQCFGETFTGIVYTSK